MIASLAEWSARNSAPKIIFQSTKPFKLTILYYSFDGKGYRNRNHMSASEHFFCCNVHILFLLSSAESLHTAVRILGEIRQFN